MSFVSSFLFFLFLNLFSKDTVEVYLKEKFKVILSYEKRTFKILRNASSEDVPEGTAINCLEVALLGRNFQSKLGKEELERDIIISQRIKEIHANYTLKTVPLIVLLGSTDLDLDEIIELVLNFKFDELINKIQSPLYDIVAKIVGDPFSPCFTDCLQKSKFT
ncbi:MAG: hypothetical protein NZ889_02000 [Candidatus Pacearchaeota archaeon]|nr:hypothetical protein [Candidatus Pacearchaeota archaeon]